jgi:hypothetical protein
MAKAFGKREDIKEGEGKVEAPPAESQS